MGKNDLGKVDRNTAVIEINCVPVGFTDTIIDRNLQRIGAMGNTDWTATFAAVCVTVTPLLLVFLVLNKAMIAGLESGATKG